MKKYTLLFIITSFLCGCIYSSSSWEKNISNCEILKGYIGIPLQLQRDVGIVKEPDLSYYHIEDLTSALYKVAKEQKADNISDDYIGTLEKGTDLLIESFRVERIYAGPIITVAVGKIAIPGSDKFKDFEYTWTHTWELDRAPWDDDSVPEKRILNLNENYTCKEK